jgi:hypothetical protein
MPKLVADYIKALGETIKQDAIAIAVYHLAAIPKGVVELLVIVHRGIEPETAVIHRIAVVGRFIKIICSAGEAPYLFG